LKHLWSDGYEWTIAISETSECSRSSVLCHSWSGPANLVGEPEAHVRHDVLLPIEQHPAVAFRAAPRPNPS
jgi:hypothetical protein